MNEKQHTLQSLAGLGRRIEAVRLSLDLTQTAMAQRLGIAISTYRTYESPASNPKAEILAQLHAWGVSMDWLFTARGEMFLANHGQAPTEDDDSNEVIKHRTLLFDMVVGMESQVQDSGLNPTPEQRANMILFMTDMMVDGKMPPMTPRLQKQMLKLIGR